MTTPQHTTARIVTARVPVTSEQAGELRQFLRRQGWRADLGWVDVGARSARTAVRAAAGGDVRRTIAYVPGLRSLDGGASRLWKEHDVPVPPVADVREVMLATDDSDEWMTESFEAPPARVEADDRELEAAGVAA